MTQQAKDQQKPTPKFRKPDEIRRERVQTLAKKFDGQELPELECRSVDVVKAWERRVLATPNGALRQPEPPKVRSFVVEPVSPDGGSPVRITNCLDEADAKATFYGAKRIEPAKLKVRVIEDVR